MIRAVNNSTGKMTEAERRSLFRRGLKEACVAELFPQQMAVEPWIGVAVYYALLKILQARS